MHLILAIAALSVAAVLLVLPLIAVFHEALRAGWHVAWMALREPDAWAAIRLSVLITAIIVPLNTIFGLAAAWSIVKCRFRFRRIMLLLIELPMTVSPVISGLVWLLLFGAQGWFGTALAAHHIKIVFALPGLALATLFVTFPYIARTIMPLMEQHGIEHEEAAITLGAGLLTIMRRITLPDIRWALASGILLCAARSMGEFGAVSVVSGHIPGVTETMPLRIEALYNDYQTVAAFALAALLSLFALVTLGVKYMLGGGGAQTTQDTQPHDPAQ